MIVAGGYVCDDGAEGVEGGIVAFLDLPLHVLGYLVHGHVAGTFDEGLYVLCPRPLYQLAHGVQLGELGRSSANWAASLASRMAPGRRPSPSDRATSYCAQMSQMSSKCS